MAVYRIRDKTKEAKCEAPLKYAFGKGQHPRKTSSLDIALNLENVSEESNQWAWAVATVLWVAVMPSPPWTPVAHV